MGQRIEIGVRAATIADLEAVREIYNHYVLSSTATFDVAPEAQCQRLDWFAEHQEESLPVIVAELPGTIVGWASLSCYKTRCAYRTSLEPSIYVHKDYTGRGVGRRLLTELIEQAQQINCRCLVGMVCSENEASMRLLKDDNFEIIGELKDVGRKFDRWLNVTIVQKLLHQQ